MAAGSGQYGGCMTEDALFELFSLERHVDSSGDVWYYNAQGKWHREYGPARVRADGSKFWYQDGLLHRLDGPAVESADGIHAWYQGGRLHRVDGPAFEQPDGHRAWFQNGKRHRIDGPAVEHSDGHREWYINGLPLTEAAWQQAVASMGLHAQSID